MKTRLLIIILASIVIIPVFSETTNEMQNTILENASLISGVKAFQDRYPDANLSINNTTGMISYQKEVPTKRPDVDSNPHVLLEVLIKNGTLQYIKLDCWDGNKSHVAVGNYNVETFLDAYICEQAISELNGISEETNIRPPRSDMPSRNNSSNYVILESKSLSPLKQFKSGIPIEEIKCRDNLQLILKTSNNSPTCVKPETKTKLLERGWGEHAPVSEPEIIKETDFDSEKYYEEFDSGSPLMYLDTSNPVLDNDNCERYAYWLTKYQKEKLDRYEDYPRYPPWGNQIFPLVDYCTSVGDLTKTVVDDKIQWEFQLNEN